MAVSIALSHERVTGLADLGIGGWIADRNQRNSGFRQFLSDFPAHEILRIDELGVNCRVADNQGCSRCNCLSGHGQLVGPGLSVAAKISMNFVLLGFAARTFRRAGRCRPYRPD